MESLTLGPARLRKNELLAGIGGSCIIHLLAFTAAFVATWAIPHQPIKPPFCTVNLVSLRDAGTGNSEPKGNPKAAEGPKVQDVPTPSARVSEKSEPVVPVKRLQLDEASRRDDAPIRKMEPKEAPKITEAAQDLTAIEKNLDKLITKPKTVPRTSSAAETGAESPPRPAAQEPSSAGRPVRANPAGPESAGRGTPSGVSEGGAKGTTQGSTWGSPEGSGAMSALAGLYIDKVIRKVQPEWRLINDKSMAGLKVVIAVHITKNGELIKIETVETSGNGLFDEAAKRAVEKAAPLPAVPEALVQPSTKLILTFLPGGIS